MNLTIDDVRRVEIINAEIALRVQGMAAVYQRIWGRESHGWYERWDMSDDKNHIVAVYDDSCGGEVDHDYYAFPIEDIIADDFIARAEVLVIKKKKAWEEERAREAEEREKSKTLEAHAIEAEERRLYEKLKAKYEVRAT